MSLKITGHPKTEAKTELEQKRKLDWYVPIFYIQSLKLFREASRINFLIISHPHITESRFSSLQNEHDKWLVQGTSLASYEARKTRNQILTLAFLKGRFNTGQKIRQIGQIGLCVLAGKS